jgi:hypothetical protein
MGGDRSSTKNMIPIVLLLAIEHRHRISERCLIHVCVPGGHRNALMSCCFLDDLQTFASLGEARTKGVAKIMPREIANLGFV